MELAALTDQQLIRLFENNQVTSKVRELYLTRVKRLIKSVNDVDEVVNHVLMKLPYQHKRLLIDFLDSRFTEEINIPVYNFSSKITKMEYGLNLIAVADNARIVIFNINTGNEIKSFDCADASKFVFGFDDLGQKFMLIKTINKITTVWVFETRRFEAIRESRQINVCPEHIYWITANVVQFYDSQVFGNIIFDQDKYQVHFNPLNVLFENELGEIDFDEISYCAENNVLKANVYDFNYNLILLAVKNTNNDLNKMEQIKKSELFNSLLPVVRADYSQRMISLACRIIDNDRLLV